MLREQRADPDHIGAMDMNGNQIIGILLVAVGLFLLVFGFNASQAPLDQVSEAFTGKFRDSTMLYLLGGVVAVVAGGALAMLGRRA